MSDTTGEHGPQWVAHKVRAKLVDGECGFLAINHTSAGLHAHLHLVGARERHLQCHLVALGASLRVVPEHLIACRHLALQIDDVRIGGIGSDGESDALHQVSLSHILRPQTVVVGGTCGCREQQCSTCEYRIENIFQFHNINSVLLIYILFSRLSSHHFSMNLEKEHRVA